MYQTTDPAISRPDPEIALKGAAAVTVMMFVVITNISQFDGAFFIFDAWSVRLACPVFIASFIGFYFVPWELRRPLVRRVLKYFVLPVLTGLVFFGIMLFRDLLIMDPEESEVGIEIITMVPFGQILFLPMILTTFVISRVIEN